LQQIDQCHKHIAWKVQGKTQGIENNISDNNGPHNAANFHHSLKHIADHLQLVHSNEALEAIRTMMPVTITILLVSTPQPDPNNPKGQLLPVSVIETYRLKEKHKKAIAKLDKLACAYIIIFHQCTPSLKNEIKASDAFPTIRNQQDPIALLKLIQSVCCSCNSKMQSVMATVAFHKHLFTYYQCNGVNNHQ
jgi:hypothetical protein